MEDWIMAGALIPFAVLIAGCVGGAFNGIGIHNSTLAKPGNEKYASEGKKYFLIFEVGYCAAIIPIKLSISWMLIRVAEGRKIYLYVQYVVIATFVIMNIIALIFILINCIPVE
jgi:phosphotransferase system  glucose/maltose/N-acetylglucosamine-specific IIC component